MRRSKNDRSNSTKAIFKRQVHDPRISLTLLMASDRVRVITFGKNRKEEDEDGLRTQTSCLSSSKLIWNIDYLNQQSRQCQAFKGMGSKSYTSNIDVLTQGLPRGTPLYEPCKNPQTNWGGPKAMSSPKQTSRLRSGFAPRPGSPLVCTFL